MAVTRYPKVGGKSCIDPGILAEDFAAVGWDASSFAGVASSIDCPVGMEPGSAWFILRRADGDALTKNSLQNITWTHENGTTTFQRYAVHRGILLGVDGDGKAPYLLELRDKRQVLKLSAIDDEYNVRRKTRGGDTETTDLFYTDTLDGEDPWTWQTMFEDVWSNLSSIVRGTAPTLPYTPVEGPENFRFHGSAWDAVGEILEALQSVLCLDPIEDEFTVQRIGAAQSGLSAAQTALRTRRMVTANPLQNVNRSVAPAKVRFYFLKRAENDGQLLEREEGGLLVEPYHTITKDTDIEGALVGTVLAYRTKFIAELDSDNTTINNASELDALADELTEKIAERYDRGTERGRDIYSGIVTTIKPGSEIHRVTWRDYGDADGCVTVTRRHPELGIPKGAKLERLDSIGSQMRLGKLNATLSQGATAEAQEIIWDESTSKFVYADTFTVKDFFLNSGETVEEDTKVAAFAFGPLWIAFPYCKVSNTLPLESSSPLFGQGEEENQAAALGLLSPEESLPAFDPSLTN